MVTAVRPSFLAASTTLAPPPRSSSILLWRSLTSDARAFDRDIVLQLGGDAFVGRLISWLDLADLDSATPNLPWTGWLISSVFSEKPALAMAGSTISDFGIVPRSMSDGCKAALFGDIVERRAAVDLAPVRPERL